jgi:hypothetical protein
VTLDRLIPAQAILVGASPDRTSYYAYPGSYGWGLSRVYWTSGRVVLKRKHVNPVPYRMK